MKFNRQRPEEVSVNLTPLIDVVFLLLIFFMVSTTFNKETRLDVELPASEQGESVTTPEQITVAVSASGEYTLNDNTLPDASRDSLLQAIKALAADPEETPFVIAADAATPHRAFRPHAVVARSARSPRHRACSKSWRWAMKVL